MSAVIQPNQCNCRNCRYVERQRSNILRAVRPAGKGISDDMVAIWNDALENYPCEFNPPVKTYQITDLQFEVDEEKTTADTICFKVTAVVIEPAKIKLEITF
jgi:hypothetical protein